MALRFEPLFRLASDEHLVERVRAGSAPAFEALFDRHNRGLLGFCRHMLGSAADAEDAVQHTFMAAYADLMSSDKPITLRPWLYTIARHRCVSMLRSRRERLLEDLPEHAADHVAAQIDTREELRETLADIARLPEDQRAALVLAELGDAPYAEIAEILECRHEKVKALVFQARSALATGRTARDTACADIRELLAVGGLGMRRTLLRQHVRDCVGCREFADELRRQRRRLRILLPVAPSFGLKRAVLGAVSASGGGATVSGGMLGAGGLAATAIVSMAIAGGGGSAEPVAEERTPGRPAAATAAPVNVAARTTGVQVRATAGLRAEATQPTRRRPVAPAPAVSKQPRRPAQAVRPAATGSPAAAPVAVSPPPAVASPSPAEVSPPPAAASPPPAAATPKPAKPVVRQPPGLEKGVTPPGPPAAPPGGGKPPETPGGRPAEPPGHSDGGPPVGGPPVQHPAPGRPAEPGRANATPGPSR